MSGVKKRYLLLKALLVSMLFGQVAAHASSADERDSWMAASRLGTPDAYQSFLEAFPDSVFAEQAFEALADSFATAAGGDTGAGGAGAGDAGAGDEGGQY